jgi:hypothetical protein
VEASVTNVIEELPAKYRPIFTEILGGRDPELLETLSAAEPSRHQREVVEDILSDALVTEFDSDDIPSGRGVLIEDLIDAFLLRWPIEHE